MSPPILERNISAKEQADVIVADFMSPSYRQASSNLTHPTHQLPRNWRISSVSAPIVVLVCVLSAFYVVSKFDHTDLIRWLQWAQKHEVEGRFIFVAAYAISLMLMLPGSILALVAGAYWGLYWGSLLVYFGNIIGQTVSFIVARYLLRDSVYGLIRARWKHFDLIDTAIRREGATLIFVLRLNPCIPYNVLNYALGITSISFLDYTWSSAISIAPFVIASVYIGCLSTNVVELLEGGWATNGAMMPWAVVSVVVITGTIAYGMWFTKRALQDAIQEAITPRSEPVDTSRLAGPLRSG